MTKNKTNIIAFPKGSSLDTSEEFEDVISSAIRAGLDEVFIVGLDSDGQVQLVCSNDAPFAMVFFMLHRAATLIIAAEEDDEAVEIFDIEEDDTHDDDEEFVGEDFYGSPEDDVEGA